MAFPKNSYLEDEYGGVSGGDESTIRWPWGTEESYSDVMGRGAGTENFNYPVPSAKPAYPITTGESAWAREIREKNAATEARSRAFESRLGSRSFFIPSKAGGPGVGKVPGQTWGAGGPTGGFMTPPSMGSMPEFKLPIWDESKIESKAQRAAGPGMRELRKGMREAQGRYYENPNVRRMTLRDAMAGYGMGLEKVLGGARREAAAEYAAEYAPKMAKATAEYGGQMNTMMAQYQAAWKEYLTRMQTVSG